MNRSRKWRMAQAWGLSFFLFLSGMAYCQGQPDAGKQALGTQPPNRKHPVQKKVSLVAFKQFELLKVDGKVVGDQDKITFGSPEFADWDGDGRTDLILGYWASWSIGPRLGAGDGGKVRFFKNRGKTVLPEYQDMGDLQCGEKPARLKEA